MFGEPLPAHPAEMGGVRATWHPHSVEDDDRDQRDDHADDKQHRVLAVIRSSLGVSRSLHFHGPTVCALVHRRRARELCRGRHSQQQYRLRRHGRIAAAYLCTRERRRSATARTLLACMQAVLATVWVSVALIAGIAGNLNSVTSWTILAGVAVIPPIVMMWRWNAPRQTMSESIQEARR